MCDVEWKDSSSIGLWSFWCNKLNEFVGLKQSCEDQSKVDLKRKSKHFYSKNKSYSELSVFQKEEPDCLRVNLQQNSSESLNEFLNSVYKDLETKQNRLIDIMIKRNGRKKFNKNIVNWIKSNLLQSMANIALNQFSLKLINLFGVELKEKKSRTFFKVR